MACFHPLAFAPSIYPLHSVARFAFIARWAARLSSMLQIINHSVFSAAVSFGNWLRFRVALRSLSVERLDRVRGVKHPAGCRRELQSSPYALALLHVTGIWCAPYIWGLE